MLTAPREQRAGSLWTVFSHPMLLSCAVGYVPSRFDTFSEAKPRGLPPLNGGELQLCLGSLLECDTGGWVWAGALGLCSWLREDPELVKGASVLDLGCGTGAVGLYAAALGASKVTLTDGGPDAVLRLAQANVEMNRELVGHAAIEVAPLRWGDSAAAHGSHDLVLGSDLIYGNADDPEVLAALCWTFAEQLRNNADCRVVMANDVRRLMNHEERLGGFQVEAEAAGLEVVTLPSSKSITLLELVESRV